MNKNRTNFFVFNVIYLLFTTSFVSALELQPSLSEFKFNNPYKYIDPDGEIPVPVVVGLASGTISAGISAYAQYRSTGTVRFGETAKAFGVGALAGLTGYGAGTLAGSALSGFGSGVAVLGGGALSGVVGGEAFTTTEAALTGQPYSFDPSRAEVNALIGLGTAGVGYKLSTLKTQKFSDLSKEAQQTIKQIETGKPENLKSLNPHVFENRPVSGKSLLPKSSDPKYYAAYDVKVSGQSTRGTNRVVAGKGGERYYTSNHYRSFTRIRGGRSRR